MMIDALSRLMPPPSDPRETSGSWSEVEASLGTPLPEDYKRFIDQYGSGAINGFVTVFNPFSRRPGLSLLEQSKQNLETLRTLHDAFGEPRPYELHPALSGLLPVAITDNGDVVHWLTDVEPSKWSIVVNEARSPDYEHFACDLTTFLAGVLRKSITCRAFPASAFDREPDFQPL